MKRFVWLPTAWLFITLSLVLPQVVIALLSATIVAQVVGAVVGLAMLGLLVLVLLRSAPKEERNGALVGAGLVAVTVALVGALCMQTAQQSITLSNGSALDGVPMAVALAQAKPNAWIRLTDARVRSEDEHTLHFVSGNRDAPTHSTISVAPITLTSEVTNDSWSMRGRVTGERPLWACSESLGWTRAWDTEARSVRGPLKPMPSNVRKSLEEELARSSLSIAKTAWCVELDPASDAKSAHSGALGIVLGILVFVPLLCLGAIAIAISKTKKD